MFFCNDLMTNGHPNFSLLTDWFCGEKEIENTGTEIFRNSRAIIRDRNLDAISINYGSGNSG